MRRQAKAAVFYFVPGSKYEFSAAVRARDSAPFYGVWFCGGFPQQQQLAEEATVRDAVFAAAAKRAAKCGGAACCSIDEMARVRCAGGERVLVAPEEERARCVTRAMICRSRARVILCPHSRSRSLSDAAVLQRRNEAIAKVRCAPTRSLHGSHRSFSSRLRALSSLASGATKTGLPSHSPATTNSTAA
jgi:hypothetical protein